MTFPTRPDQRTITAPDSYSREAGQARSSASAALPRRRLKWLLATLVVASSAAGAFLFTQLSEAQQQTAKSSAKGARRAMPVGVALVKTGNFDVTLTGLGTVTPLNTVTVKSRLDGQLMKVLFAEGQLVGTGDVLAEIDSRPYLVQLKQVEGQLSRDQALLKNAQLDLERYRLLHQQESIAKQLLDTQEALVRQHEATVKIDQAAIENAKLQVDYCRITAPVSGRLGLRQVDAGNMVHASDPNGIVVITQLQPINVVFTLPEDRVPEVIKRILGPGRLPVEAYDRGGKAMLATGVLLTIDNQIDLATGTVKLKAQFANSDHRLFPNQFVNARMLLEVKRDVAIIPAAAVQRGTLGSFVYAVQNDHTVTMRSVTLGPTQRDTVVVDAGLAPNEMIVLDGADKLREGAKVEIAAGDGAPPEDAPARSEKKARKKDKVSRS